MKQGLEQRQRRSQSLRFIFAMNILEASRSTLRRRMLLEASVNPAIEVGRRGATPAADVINSEEVAAPATSLHQHLRDQLNVLPLSNRQLVAVEWLIDLLDPRGFLTQTTSAVVEELNAWLDREDSQREISRFQVREVERAVAAIKTLDPTGVGARSTAECYLIQLRETARDDPLVTRLLTECAEQVHSEDWAAAASSLDRPLEEIQESADVLKRLDPSPGLVFLETKHVEPDGVVELLDGQLRATVLEYDFEARRTKDSVANPDQRQRADFFLNGLSERREKLKAVLERVIHRQRDAFEQGFERMAPLTRTEVADDLGLDPTWIVRAVKDTWVQTPLGLLPLAAFFSSSRIRLDNGAFTTATGVKIRIKDLVDEEDPRNPLTDQQIVEHLGQSGVRVSRTAVGKYRRELDIATHSARRQRPATLRPARPQDN